MESMGNLSMERKNNRAGNYDLSVGQLKALLEWFESNSELLERYDNLVNSYQTE